MKTEEDILNICEQFFINETNRYAKGCLKPTRLCMFSNAKQWKDINLSEMVKIKVTPSF